MIAALAAHADPELNRWVVKYGMPVQRNLERPMERAIARGEIPKSSNPRVLTSMLLGPLLLLTVFTKVRPDPEFVHELAKTIIRVSRNDIRASHRRT